MDVADKRGLKNIIIINDFNYEQGGATKIAIDTANMLAEKHYHVVFISAISQKNSNALSKTIEQYSLNSREFLKYDNKFEGMFKGIKNNDFSRLVASIIQKYSRKDTIIHVHGWTKGCSASFFPLLKKKHFTTIITLHEYFSMCANGAYYDYKRKIACQECPGSVKCLLKNCDSRNYLFKIYRSIRQLFYRRYMDFNYLNAIFVSEFQRDLIRKYISFDHNQVIENPYYLEIKENQTKKWDYIYIGRTTAEKGADYFLRLAKDMPDQKFVIVGNFQGKTTGNVTVTGWVSEEAVMEYLCSSKVLILPSLWPETFGLNVFKAIKQGIPCLVSSNTAAEKIISNENGLVFQQGNYNDMKKKAEEVINLKPEIKKFDDNRNELYIEKILDFYNKSLSLG